MRFAAEQKEIALICQYEIGEYVSGEMWSDKGERAVRGTG